MTVSVPLPELVSLPESCLITRFDPYCCNVVKMIPVEIAGPAYPKAVCKFFQSGQCKHSFSGVRNGIQGCQYLHGKAEVSWCSFVTKNECRERGDHKCKLFHIEDISKMGSLNRRRLEQAPRLSREQISHVESRIYSSLDRISATPEREEETLKRFHRMIYTEGTLSASIHHVAEKVLNELTVLPFSAMRHHSIIILIHLCSL